MQRHKKDLKTALVHILEYTSSNPEDWDYLNDIFALILGFGHAMRAIIDSAPDINKTSGEETRDILTNIFKTGEGNNDKSAI